MSNTHLTPFITHFASARKVELVAQALGFESHSWPLWLMEMHLFALTDKELGELEQHQRKRNLDALASTYPPEAKDY